MIRSATRPGLRAILIGFAAATLALAACAPPAPPPKPAATDAKPAAAVTGDAAAGRTLFTAKGCIACHTAQGVQGATGTIGPNLNGIGDPMVAGHALDVADCSLERLDRIVLEAEREREIEDNLGVGRARDLSEQRRVDGEHQISSHQVEVGDESVVDEQPAAVAERVAVRLLHR